MHELEDLEFDHNEIRRAAEHDAAMEYETETAMKVGVERGWISQETATLLIRDSLCGLSRDLSPKRSK
jgi:hypothetical protein